MPSMSRLAPSLLLTAFALCGLAACNDNKSSAPSTPTEAPATAVAPTPSVPAATAANDVGKSVYNKTCSLCHSAGVGGAPKPGDKTDWAPRIAQGKDTLYKHALEGFTGNKGMMPARGGNTTLTDDEVKAAVDYQVAQSQ